MSAFSEPSFNPTLKVDNRYRGGRTYLRSGLFLKDMSAMAVRWLWKEGEVVLTEEKRGAA